MKAVYFACSILFLLLFNNCKKQEIIKESQYVFTKPFCSIVTVGGVVGITEKCFSTGDTITGYQKKEEKITIRIAEHSYRNEGPPSNMSYQEFLEVPLDYLEELKN